MSVSAIDLLTKAIEYDVNGRKMEAMKLYETGIGELMKMCKAETRPDKKDHFQKKISEYMDRAEQIKILLTKWSTKGEIKDKIYIMEGSSGFSYRTIFSKYMDDSVKEILIDEPYFREYYQLCNLVMFCELAVSKCRNLKFINVKTVQDTRPTSEQNKAFSLLTDSLAKKNITLFFEYSEHMHDRQIILSNGYIIKIGRGLNYFKGTQNKFSIGSFDYDYRECKETNIDILYCPENKK